MDKCPLDDMDNPPWRWKLVRLYVDVSLDHTVEVTANVCKSHTVRELQAFAECCVDEHLGGITADVKVAG